MLGVPPGALIKAFPVVVEGRGPVLVVVRGDHRVNEIKLQNALGAPFRAATAGGGGEPLRRAARVHRPRGRARAEVLADEALRGLRGLVAGANEPGRPPARRGARP